MSQTRDINALSGDRAILWGWLLGTHLRNCCSRGRSPGRVRMKGPQGHQGQEGPVWGPKPPQTRPVRGQPCFPGPAHTGLMLMQGPPVWCKQRQGPCQETSQGMIARRLNNHRTLEGLCVGQRAERPREPETRGASPPPGEGWLLWPTL